MSATNSNEGICPFKQEMDQQPNEVDRIMDSSDGFAAEEKSESTESVCIKVIKCKEYNNVVEESSSQDQSAFAGEEAASANVREDEGPAVYIRNIVIRNSAVNIVPCRNTNGLAVVPETPSQNEAAGRDTSSSPPQSSSQRAKSFKSTEVQTDNDFAITNQIEPGPGLITPPPPPPTREQRRRDRQERRQNRAQNQSGGRHYHPNNRAEPTIQVDTVLENHHHSPENHFQPPPYSTLPPGSTVIPHLPPPSGGNHNYAYRQHPLTSASGSPRLPSSTIPQPLPTSITTPSTADDPRFLFPLPVIRR